MFANLENSFHFIFLADGSGNLKHRKFMIQIRFKKRNYLPLKCYNISSCFFPCFNTRLMIGIDVDEGGVKTNCTLEQGN